MAVVVAAQIHLHRVRAIQLQDAMASWLRAYRAVKQAWRRVQADPQLELMLSPEIDALQSRVNRS